MTDDEKLNLYRNALAEMVRRAGGSVIVTFDDLNRLGSLLNREQDDGFEFRIADDTVSH